MGRPIGAHACTWSPGTIVWGMVAYLYLFLVQLVPHLLWDFSQLPGADDAVSVKVKHLEVLPVDPDLFRGQLRLELLGLGHFRLLRLLWTHSTVRHVAVHMVRYDMIWYGMHRRRLRGQPGHVSPNNWETSIHLSLFTTFCPPQYFGLPTMYFWQVYASDGMSNSYGKCRLTKLHKGKRSSRRFNGYKQMDTYKLMTNKE